MIKELIVDDAGHAHAQERDSRHQEQQPDRDAEDLQADGEAHRRLLAAETRPDLSVGRHDQPRIIAKRRELAVDTVARKGTAAMQEANFVADSLLKGTRIRTIGPSRGASLSPRRKEVGCRSGISE
jgi:hypothetical protein